VTFNFNLWAEASDILPLSPDVVIIATGGLPQAAGLDAGEDLCVQAWDILSGDVKPGSNVLLYDDAGDHTALQTAEALANAGATVEVMTPDRSFAPEVMGMNLAPYMRNLQGKSVTFTVTYRLQSVARDGNRLRAVIGSDYIRDLAQEKSFDQVVINHGTAPNADLYFALKPQSENLGAVDYDALIAGQPQPKGDGPQGFRLYRIGDAVESRNTHAAIYDALRLMKDI